MFKTQILKYEFYIVNIVISSKAKHRHLRAIQI